MVGDPAPRALPALPEPRPGAGFVRLVRAEFAAALGLRHAVALAALALMGVACAFWLPLFPPSLYQFFARVFALEGWPAIVVGNDLAGLLFFVYWVAAFDVLAIVVVPRETGYLDILLAKPLARSTYLLARLLPALALAVGLGILGAVACWLGLAAAGLSFDPSAYVGAAAAVVAFAVCLASFANLLILGARETFSALLIAFVPIFAAMLPGMLFMYRPDVFADAPLLRDLAIFPLNLVWYPDFAARWGLALAAALIALAAALVALAGRRLEARDV